MKIGTLNNNGTINDFTNSQVYVTPQGIQILQVKPDTQTSPKSQKPKGNKEKSSKAVATLEKPMTLKYYKHGNNGILRRQEERVSIVYKKFNEWGWLDDDTSSDDFDSFFQGERRYCNIEWKANATILTILLLELLKKEYIEKQAKCSATSLVEKQFLKTPNSDRTRITVEDKDRIGITLFILDINNPLPTKQNRYDERENVDVTDAALYAVYSGMLRSTKGI